MNQSQRDYLVSRSLTLTRQVKKWTNDQIAFAIKDSRETMALAAADVKHGYSPEYLCRVMNDLTVYLNERDRRG